MAGIAELVSQAESLQAEAFAVAGDRPFELTGADGQRYPLDPVGGERLHQLVEATLDQDQLTDLMVGRPVGFSLEVSGNQWRLLVEPGSEGLSIRGTRARTRKTGKTAAIEDLDIQLDAPSPSPVGFGDSSTSGLGLVDPENRELESRPDPAPPARDFDAFAPPPTPRGGDGFGEVDAPRPAHELSSTLFEPMSQSDDTTLLTQRGRAAPAPEAPKSAPSSQSQSPSPSPSPSTEAKAKTPTRRIEMGSGKMVPPPSPQRTPSGAHQAAREERPSGTLMAMRPPGMEAANKAPPASGRHAPAGSMPAAPSAVLSQDWTGEFKAVEGGSAPRSEELAMGSLCFVRELSEALEAGTRMGMGVEVIRDEDFKSGPGLERGPTVSALGVEAGASLIVDLDDPSRGLGWILLRREEGFRVFVVTRALRPEGARRALMGLHTSERIESWLDSGPVVALMAGEYMPL